MEEEHHKKSKSRSGSNEFVTINILPPKEPKDGETEKKQDRNTQLKVAAIAACSAIAAAGITATVTLTIQFSKCE